MPHYVPYLALLIASLSLLIWVIYRNRQYETVVLFFALAGMIYCFEFVICILLNSYTYDPHIVRIHYYDHVLGSIVSNLFAVPIISLFISVYQLKFRWLVLFIGMFAGIETLFLRLGVYEHHWWRTVYTMASLLFFFSLSRYWWKQLLKGNRIIQYISLVMYTFSLVATLMLILGLAGFRLYKASIFSDIYHNDIVLSSSLSLLFSMIVATTVYTTRKLRWLIAALAAILAIDLSLVHLGIQQVYISLLLFYGIHLVCCGLIALLDITALRSLRK